MKTALLQVKEELGVDAVIMSNKKVAGGVEIVAAVDGDTAPAPAKRYNSQPRHGYNQVSPSVAPTKSRELADDRVSLQSSADSGRSMTQRFANMLKQYSSADEQEHRAENEDSLSALLKRQSENRAPQRNQTQRSQSSSERQRPDSPLGKLLQEDADARRKPRLDPTRYDRKVPEEPMVAVSELESMREEMTSIRRLLEHQVSGLMWQEVERREPLRAMLIKRLERMGVSLEMADQLACYIPEETPPPKAWKALLGLVSDQIPVVKHDILKRGGVVPYLGQRG